MIARHASDLRVLRLSPFEAAVRTGAGEFRVFQVRDGEWRAVDRYGVDVDAPWYASGDDAVDAVFKYADGVR